MPVRTVLLRDLASLAREIEAYPDDTTPWYTPPGISNAAGTLALHCAGNLQHFVGACLGGTGYVRDRAAEFSRRGASRAALVAELDRARAVVDTVLATLPAERRAAPFPQEFQGKAIGTEQFLVHLATHLAYHLGQVDYHRRLVTGQGALEGVVGVPV